MSDGGMLDLYLLTQALGWNWDLGSILLLAGIGIGIFVLIFFGIFLLDWYLNYRRFK